MSPAVLVVDDDGQATPANCNASALAHSSISAAIAAASSGDLILVCPGVYVEQVTLNKDNVTVRSVSGPAVTVIRPTELVPAAVRITGNDSTFQGFRVEDTTSGHSHAHRLIFIQGDRVRVLDNVLRGRGPTGYSDSGILIRGGGVGDGVAADALVEGNEVSNLQNNGILAVSVSSNNAASDPVIQHNVVRGILGNGIAVDRVSGAEVRGNVVEGNTVGLYFSSSAALPAADCLFRCNDLVDNAEGARNEATDGRLMDARYNWWGDTRGPSGAGLGHGDSVTAQVEFAPWLVAPSGGVRCEAAAAALSSVPPALVSIPFATSGLEGSPLGVPSALSDFILGLVATDFENNRFLVYTGRGDGTFRLQRSYAVGRGPAAIVQADFDADGHADVVTANMLADSLSIAYGNGNGTFGRIHHLSSGGKRPRAVAIGDFNRDGWLDLAVANEGSNTVALFLGGADRAPVLARTLSLTGGLGPTAILAADINLDGLLDLALANALSHNVVILLGDGQGGFTEAGAFGVGRGPVALLATDFDRDGRVDLVSVNSEDESLSLLQARGGSRGVSFLRRDLKVGRTPLSLAGGEFVAGSPGIAVANFGEGTVSVFFRTEGRGGMAARLLRALADPAALTTGDFNGDGYLDLVVMGATARDLATFLNQGEGRFVLKR